MLLLRCVLLLGSSSSARETGLTCPSFLFVGNQVDPRGDVTNVFLSLNSADSASRLAAVRTLLEKLENKGDGMDVDEDVEVRPCAA